MTRKRLIVGISGASGIIYGIRMLQALRNADVESHLVMSKSAVLTLKYEVDMPLADVKALADHCYSISDVAATISSGSFKTAGMIVAPCSIRTMSDIAYGSTANLLSRAADVVLKERRQLVLMLRETPLHLGHLRTACQVAEIGAVLMPTVPAFYNRPQTLDDIINHSVGRALDLFDIETDLVNRWRSEDQDNCET